MATTQVLCQTCNNQLRSTDSGLACSCNRGSATGGNSAEDGSIIQPHTLSVYDSPLARVANGIHPYRVTGHEDSAAGSATGPVGGAGSGVRLLGVDEHILRPMGIDAARSVDPRPGIVYPLMLFNGSFHAARLARVNMGSIPNPDAHPILQITPFAAPLSRTEINAIPTVSVTSEDVDNQSSCVICCDLFILGTIITKLTCNHLFHTSCIGDWLKKSGNCPICRRLFSQPNVVPS